MIKYSEYEQEAINVALSAIQQTLTNANVMNSPEEVQNYLKIKLAAEPDEWFAVMYLTNQHHLISFEKLFRGTVNASHPYQSRCQKGSRDQCSDASTCLLTALYWVIRRKRHYLI